MARMYHRFIYARFWYNWSSTGDFVMWELKWLLLPGVAFMTIPFA